MGGEGPASLRPVGCLAVPGRFEEPEASVMLGARKPECKWALSHSAEGNSAGGDPGQGGARDQTPKAGRGLEIS